MVGVPSSGRINRVAGFVGEIPDLTPVMSRPTWTEFAMQLAAVAASRSEDPYVKVGACVLRRDHSVAGLGYNGAPSGIEIDWSNRDERRQYVIHAEANALRYLRPDEGALLAVTLAPCANCLTLIASHRIPTVFYRDEAENYDLGLSMRVAKQLGILLQRVDDGDTLREPVEI